MTIEISSYTRLHARTWDDWCAEAVNATFLHSREFLNYHGDRFTDASAILLSGNRYIGLLPAATMPGVDKVVCSHPGSTYGGIVHHGWLTGERMLEAFERLSAHYQRMGYTRFVYRPLPYIYFQRPAQDDIYALSRMGAQLFRCDLACAVDLSSPGERSNRRRRCLRKASESVKVVDGMKNLPDYWNVLIDNLQRKYSAAPLHTLPEISDLVRRFPRNITLRSALHGSELVAGVVVFVSSQVWHAQYIASSELGYQLNALDAVFHHLLGEAKAAGARYFDFGTSNEDGGRVLNQGLYRYKAEWGASGVVYEHYEWEL